MLLSDDSMVLLGSIMVIILTFLTIKYSDRVIFDPVRPIVTHFKGWPLIGSTLDIATSISRTHHFFLNVFETTGALTVTISSLGFPRGVVTIDPSTIEYILKTNFGNYIKGSLFHYSTSHLLGNGIFNANGTQWRNQRKTAALIFNVKNFRDHFSDVFVRELQLVCGIFDQAMEKKAEVDFHDIMYRFTLDSFVDIAFGVHLNALGTIGSVPFAESFDVLQKNVFDRSINVLEPVNRCIREIFMPWKPTVAAHLKVVDDFAASVIKKRRAQLAAGQSHKDLLSRFLETSNENGEPLTDKELRDNIMNFTMAGRDTTAQTLAWMLYNLIRNPEIEKKIVKEIEESILDGMEQDSVALYEATKGMIYAKACFYETLRLHPVVPVNQKEAIEEDILPDGTPIHPGDVVIWSSFSLGRSKKVWGDDAKEFKPERWITENGDLRREPQGKWPAFHAGPRVCLGQSLATLQSLIAISWLLKRYKFTLVPGQDVTYQVSISLPMKYGLMVTIDPRQ